MGCCCQKGLSRLGVLEGKLLQKAKEISVVLACNKKLVELKELLKQTEQQFYNMGFNDAESSSGPIIFGARQLGFMQG